MDDNMPVGQRHLHWEFAAFDDSVPDEAGGEKVHWGITVDVIGYENEADALIAAQSIVQRKTWKLRRVWECPSCGFQAKMVDTLSKMTQ